MGDATPTVPSRLEHADRARSIDAALVDRIVRGLQETDTVADAAVAELRSQPDGSGWRSLDEVLAGTPPFDTLGPAMRALLEDCWTVPHHVDLDAVDRGAVAYWRAGGLHRFSLFGALLYGYQFSGFVKPLAMTGRIEHMASRRVVETGRWVAVATRPGGTRPGTPGFAETIRVRLVHAMVRAHLWESGRWRADLWGAPISVVDGAAVINGGFLHLPVHMLLDAGVRLSEDELDDICAMWRWIGHLQGVPEDLLPTSIGFAERFVEVSGAASAGPDEDGRRLTAALLDSSFPMTHRLRGPLAPLAPRVSAVLSNLIGSMCSRYMDRDIARTMGVPTGPFRHTIPAMRPMVWAMESARAAGIGPADDTLVNWNVSRFERAMELVQPDIRESVHPGALGGVHSA